MRHPAKHYLKYLLITASPIDYYDFCKLLINKAIPDIWSTAFDELVNEIEEVTEQNANDVSIDAKTIDREKLKNLGIAGLVFPDVSSLQAIKLYNENPLQREAIETLLIGGYSPYDVAIKINTRFDTTYTEQVINYYRHYFWNTEAMGEADWVSYYKTKQKYDNSHPKNLSVLKAGKELALLKAGMQNETISSNNLLQTLKAALYETILETRGTELPLLAKIHALTSLVKATVSLDKHISGDKDRMKDILNLFKTFKLEGTQPNIISVEDLLQSEENELSHSFILEEPKHDA